MKHKIQEANHLLECVHAIGKKRKIYYQPCILVKEMDKLKVKVIPLMDRYGVALRTQRARYVFSFRVHEWGAESKKKFIKELEINSLFKEG